MVSEKTKLDFDVKIQTDPRLNDIARRIMFGKLVSIDEVVNLMSVGEGGQAACRLLEVNTDCKYVIKVYQFRVAN